MGFLDSHAHTAVTTTINKLIEQTDPSGEDGIMESELGNLLDLIRTQSDSSEPGPTEAARAIRKKLKYGTASAQMNALNLLDLIVANGGKGKMALFYNDRKLANRIVVAASSYQGTSGVDRHVVKRAQGLLWAWKDEYEGDETREELAKLYLRCSMCRVKAKKHEVPDFMNDDADLTTPFEEIGRDEPEEPVKTHRRTVSKPKTNRELDKQFRIPKLDYDKETPRIYKTIAAANVLSTNLEDSLHLLQPGELSIHSSKANDCFDQCRVIRRKILRYLQLVDKEDLVSALLKCNDDLVASLKHYADKSEPAGAPKSANDDADSVDSLSAYETDDSLDDGLDSRFRDLSEPVPQATRDSTSLLAPSIHKKRGPPIPAKAPELRLPKPSFRRNDSTSTEGSGEEGADPFSDTHKVEKAAVWR